MSMLNIGVSTLLATQASLSVASNNIANSTTDGYTRQSLSLVSTQSVNVGGVQMGQGVNMVDVVRIGSDYLETALRNASADKSFYSSFTVLGLELDKVLSEQSTGLDKSIQSMFTSIGDLANSPSSQATRAVVLDNLGVVAQKFNSYGELLQNSREGVDRDMAAYVDRINVLAADLVQINKSLARSKAQTGSFSSELLDKQNLALDELSRYADVMVNKKSDGSASVYLAGGVSLVSDNIVSELEYSDQGYELAGSDIFIRGINITSGISGGELGGLIHYRESVLTFAENQIGQIAIGLGQMLNAQHSLGFTVAGVPGANLVSDFSAVGNSHDNNTGTGFLTAKFDSSQPYSNQLSDVSDLKARSYEVLVVAGGYELYDHSTGALLSSGVGSTFKHEGLEFEVSAGAVLQDRYYISPGQQASVQFSKVISDPDNFANGHIATGSTSDNRNSLALYELKSLKVLNGVDSFQSAYSTLTASIGSRVSTGETNLITATLASQQALANRESLSGVNVEEEAANLLKFQQQYSAAAKIITTSQELFEILIDSVR